MADHTGRHRSGWETTRDVALASGFLSVFGTLAFLIVTWRLFGDPVLGIGGLVPPVAFFALYFVARRKAALVAVPTSS